jgi:hypothetical protein
MRCFRVLGFALVVGLAVSQQAQADTIVLRDWTTGNFANNASGGGGPFQATTNGTLLGSSTFVTFCLEFNEHFNYNQTYNFTTSNAAVVGGLGGRVCDSSGNCTDPVSDATRWLYYQVVSGGYLSFTQFGTGAGVGARVQEAIWYLEQERTTSQISANALTLANFALTRNWSALYNQGHRVFALNITTSAGVRAQDQLGYTRLSVPEPGTIAMMALGLAGLGTVRRRRASRRA